MWLLDTNVLSEQVRPRPDPRVVGWFAEHERQTEALFVATVSLAEIRRGVMAMAADHPRVPAFRRWLEAELPARYGDRILSFDPAVANRWADMTVGLPRGLVLPVFDSILAATALHHRLTLLTRNVRDFDRIPGLAIANPFRD
jgi:hypothetical protein